MLTKSDSLVHQELLHHFVHHRSMAGGKCVNMWIPLIYSTYLESVLLFPREQNMETTIEMKRDRQSQVVCWMSLFEGSKMKCLFNFILGITKYHSPDKQQVAAREIPFDSLITQPFRVRPQLNRWLWMAFIIILYLVGGWTNPLEKYARQNGNHFRNFRGENKKSLSCHHPVVLYSFFFKTKISAKPTSVSCPWDFFSFSCLSFTFFQGIEIFESSAFPVTSAQVGSGVPWEVFIINESFSATPIQQKCYLNYTVCILYII